MIIGTAGHIDHGKTVLIKALTGVDTDRLKEEKKRGISIELGFAEFKLPSGRVAGVVDVPGHEHFVKNMLAGATGFDMVLMVVAADDGVMPQTKEHLAIVNLLGVKKGIVALTKADLVDNDMLALVEEEVRETLKGTALENAPVIPVSALTGSGIDVLLKAIDKVAETVREKERKEPFRLPIDRVFTLKGVGTVITGTLWSGELREGDNATILPPNIGTRIRSVQVHGKTVKMASAGQRVAVNLPGVSRGRIARGDVLLAEGTLFPTYMVDAYFQLLSESSRKLKNWTRVRVHHGTQEVLSRLVLLDKEDLTPGERAFVQFRLEKPLVAKAKDHFIVRSYSPMTTIGGGEILDTHPRKHKRFDEEVLNNLKILRKHDPLSVINLILSEERLILSKDDIVRRSELTPEEVSQALKSLKEEGKVHVLTVSGEEHFVSIPVYQAFQESVISFLENHHRAHPLETGVSKERLRASTIGWLAPKAAEALLRDLNSQKLLVIEEDLVRSSEVSRTTSAREELRGEIEKVLLENKFMPPSPTELRSRMGLGPQEMGVLLSSLKKEAKVVAVKPDLYFHKKALEEAQAKIQDFLKDGGKMTVSEFKDLVGTTRKYAVPLVEYFDRQKVTKREGDYRVLV